MNIYTKRGDYGNTNVIGGRTVKKTDPYVAAYGEIDEVNAQVGMLLSLIKQQKEVPHTISKDLTTIQHHLFDIGSILSDKENKLALSFPGSNISELEKKIDYYNRNLPKIDYFVLPGGDLLAAQAHIVRTIVRRVERNMVALLEHGKVNKQALIYMNRLSDYFFVLARYINDNLNVEETFYKNTGKVFH